MGGILLVQEAGGVVTDTAGSPMTIETITIVAANPAVHAQLLNQLQTQP
jgi:myo-inositol-1(or 4)-monophosphatase